MEKVKGSSLTDIPAPSNRWTWFCVPGKEETHSVFEMESIPALQEKPLFPPLMLQQRIDLPKRSRDEMVRNPQEHFYRNTRASVSAAS